MKTLTKNIEAQVVSKTKYEKQMSIQEQCNIAEAYNWLMEFKANHPGPHHYGGDAQLRNIAYVLNKHAKDIPKTSDGIFDYQFIYKNGH